MSINIAENKHQYDLGLAGKIEMIRMSVRAITRGFKQSRIITGLPGIGKSMAILDELESENANYIHISGGVKNARALFMQLYDKNDEDLILFFDDVNDIFTSKESREILRVAVTNDKIRNITYTDNVLAKEPFKYQSPLKFKSKIVIATNIPKRKIDPAIVSRTNAIEIIVSKEETFEYINSICHEYGIENYTINEDGYIDFNFV
jgi:hypothetical protein